MFVWKLSSFVFCFICVELFCIVFIEYVFIFYFIKYLKVSERIKVIFLIIIEYFDWLVNKEKV